MIQGVTEFLPVSSSGHLVIFQKLLGFTKPPVSFDILLHTATLLDIVFFFRKEIRQAGKSLILAIAAATVPTGLIGLALNTKKDFLFNSLPLVSLALLGTTFFLFSTLKLRKANKPSTQNITLKTALTVGMAQGLAVLPGLSRSGATIVTGLWMGLERDQAVQFAFLIAIPAIFGAQLLELSHLSSLGELVNFPSLVGFLTAVISGWISLALVKQVVYSAKLHLFALYTFVLSLLILFA